MSKQNSLDKYFMNRKESNEHTVLTKERRVENENIMVQSKNNSY